MDTTQLFNLPQYHLSKKRFKMLGAEVNIYAGDSNQGQHLFNAKMKAFKLWEDIKVTDNIQQNEIFSIKQRKEYKLGHDLYDVVDSQTQQVIGSFQRLTFDSIVQDKWNILDPNGNTIAILQEDSVGLALLRRFLTNLVPQNYDVLVNGQRILDLKQNFSFFGISYELSGDFSSNNSLDPRLGIAAMILLATIEGRQQ